MTEHLGDENRRNFLRAVAASGLAYIAGGYSSGFLNAAGEKTFNTIFEKETVENAELDALLTLFGKLTDPPSVYAGRGNVIGASSGLQGVSDYLRFASSRFCNYISVATGFRLNTVTDNGGAEFLYDPNNNGLFLGSPVANEMTSKLLGYSETKVIVNEKNVTLPKPSEGKLRWALTYGDTNFGVYGGKEERALRYSNRTGLLVERPIYKLLDRNDHRIYAPKTTNGFLSNEWLTILRIKELGTYKVVIAGMHGYSTEAFCRDITSNLDHLAKAVGGAEQFQLVVPVSLDHTTNAIGKHCTVGQIDWRDALVQNMA